MKARPRNPARCRAAPRARGHHIPGGSRSLLPLRNELRLRLGPQHRAAEVWSGGLFPRLAGETAQPGASTAPIDELVATLAAAGLELPRRLGVRGGRVRLLRHPAGAGSWKEANAAAGEYFAGLLGDADLLVDTTLAPCGTRWIAAAIDAALVQGWRQALEGHGVALHGVRPAMLEDLWALRPHVAIDDGVLAMVRSEGVSLIALAGGGVVDVAWGAAMSTTSACWPTASPARAPSCSTPTRRSPCRCAWWPPRTPTSPAARARRQPRLATQRGAVPSGTVTR